MQRDMPDLTPEQERRIARAPKKRPWTPPEGEEGIWGEQGEPAHAPALTVHAFTEALRRDGGADPYGRGGRRGW